MKSQQKYLKMMIYSKNGILVCLCYIKCLHFIIKKVATENHMYKVMNSRM